MQAVFIDVNLECMQLMPHSNGVAKALDFIYIKNLFFIMKICNCVNSQFSVNLQPNIIDSIYIHQYKQEFYSHTFTNLHNL